MPEAALFDLDGTLVDTNYHHTLAWARAFHRFDYDLPLWRIHRAIGMGGDQLIEAVAGREAEIAHGDELRARWGVEYAPLLPEVRPFQGSRALVEAVKARGFVIVLATSAPQEHLDTYLELLGIGDIVDHSTTADDVENSKPAPDLVSVAMKKAGTRSAVMVGDSTWDVIAAGKVDVPTITIRTGGFSVDELREAGSVGTYDSPAELTHDLDHTLLNSAD
jgi:phosphoglycolate phosphatase-like HAD superfamily hydrolase